MRVATLLLLLTYCGLVTLRCTPGRINGSCEKKKPEKFQLRGVKVVPMFHHIMKRSTIRQTKSTNSQLRFDNQHDGSTETLKAVRPRGIVNGLIVRRAMGVKTVTYNRDPVDSFERAVAGDEFDKLPPIQPIRLINIDDVKDSGESNDISKTTSTTSTTTTAAPTTTTSRPSLSIRSQMILSRITNGGDINPPQKIPVPSQEFPTRPPAPPSNVVKKSDGAQIDTLDLAVEGSTILDDSGVGLFQISAPSLIGETTNYREKSEGSEDDDDKIEPVALSSRDRRKKKRQEETEENEESEEKKDKTKKKSKKAKKDEEEEEDDEKKDDTDKKKKKKKKGKVSKKDEDNEDDVKEDDDDEENKEKPEGQEDDNDQTKEEKDDDEEKKDEEKDEHEEGEVKTSIDLLAGEGLRVVPKKGNQKGLTLVAEKQAPEKTKIVKSKKTKLKETVEKEVKVKIGKKKTEKFEKKDKTVKKKVEKIEKSKEKDTKKEKVKKPIKKQREEDDGDNEKKDEPKGENDDVIEDEDEGYEDEKHETNEETEEDRDDKEIDEDDEGLRKPIKVKKTEKISRLKNTEFESGIKEVKKSKKAKTVECKSGQKNVKGKCVLDLESSDEVPDASVDSDEVELSTQKTGVPNEDGIIIGSPESTRIETSGQKASQKDAPNAKYYFPPKSEVPLDTCFHNPSGYVCCNLQLNNVIEETYQLLKAETDFSSCNIGKVAKMIQMKSEETFEHPFESIVALGDFAQNIHFAGDLVCKLEIDGKYIISYATPYDAEHAKGPHDDEEEKKEQEDNEDEGEGQRKKPKRGGKDAEGKKKKKRKQLPIHNLRM